ncbi:unnamed protein product, partial [Sphacelaria rigidula]
LDRLRAWKRLAYNRCVLIRPGSWLSGQKLLTLGCNVCVIRVVGRNWTKRIELQYMVVKYTDKGSGKPRSPISTTIARTGVDNDDLQGCSRSTDGRRGNPLVAQICGKSPGQELMITIFTRDGPEPASRGVVYERWYLQRHVQQFSRSCSPLCWCCFQTC